MPLLGNFNLLPDLSKGETFDDVLLKVSKEYGRVFLMNYPLVLGKMLVVADPELAKKIFVTKNCDKSKLYKDLFPILGKGSIVTLEGGKEWSNLRKTFNPGFTPAFLKDMVTTMVEKLDRFLGCIEANVQQNKVTTMLEVSQMYTSDVILAVAYGEHWDSIEPHPARVYEDEAVHLFALMIQNPLRNLFDFYSKYKLRCAGKRVDQEMRSILERRLADMSKNKEETNICSLAIKSLQKEDGSLSEEDKLSIISNLKTFYFAGHDTTATTVSFVWKSPLIGWSVFSFPHFLLGFSITLVRFEKISWAIWLLSQNNEILSKVRAELKEKDIWSDLSKAPPTYDDLQKCEYLEAVIKETLRLYSPATGLTRSSSGFTETYNGCSLEGPMFDVNVHLMHHHPDNWKEPETFRPERFLDGSEENINAKFFPFSRGPRDCIGKHFAILEAKLAIAALVVRYDLECADVTDRIKYAVTNIPLKGCPVRLRPRAK